MSTKKTIKKTKNVLIISASFRPNSNSHALCQLTGIFNGSMVFFVGLEFLSVLVSAESLAQKPFSVFCYRLALGTARLIADTNKSSSVRKGHLKPKLVKLC